MFINQKGWLVFFIICTIFGMLLPQLIFCQQEYRVQIYQKVPKPSVQADKASFQITWHPVPSALQYTVEYTQDISDTSFTGASVQRETLTDTTFMFQNVDLLRTYIFRIGYFLTGVDSAFGWSDIMECQVTKEAQGRVVAPTKKGFIFFTAFISSLSEMDYWGVFVLFCIFLCLLWGLFLSFFRVNRRIVCEDYDKNKSLGTEVIGSEGILKQWMDSVGDREKLKRLYGKYFGIKESEERRSAYAVLNMIRAGLKNHIDNFSLDIVSSEVDRDMEKMAAEEKERLICGFDNRKGSLRTILILAELAPMLGLFGTVCGLIVAFYNILVTTQQSKQLLQSDILQNLSIGIYSAIVTTIIGLFCGIILLGLYSWLKLKVDKLYSKWETLYIDISTMIHPQKESE